MPLEDVFFCSFFVREFATKNQVGSIVREVFSLGGWFGLTST